MIKNLALGGSNRGLLILALVLGMVFAVLVGVYLSSLDGGEGGGSGSAATVPVVVAAVDIPPQTAITAEMVTVKEVPVDIALAGAYIETGEAVGKLTQIQIVANQQLLNSNAIDPATAQAVYGPDAPLSLVIPQGKRAFAIYVSQVASVGGLVRAGDHIDLMVSSEAGSGDAEADAGGLAPGVACVAMQDVEVLAIAQTLRRAGASADSSAIAGVPAVPDANTMTLAVTPEQTVQLAAVQKSVSDASVGKQMWVVLRPFGDHSIAAVPSCDLGTSG